MKVVKCGLNFYDSDSNIINHFMKSNLTFKISSSFNVGYILDTKKTSMVVYVL